MRMSRLFGKTLRQVPAEAETPSHRLLLRAGMVQQVSAGVYAYLPLGWAVLEKIERIIREEMDREGGQEMRMPSILPIELYQQSGRDQTMKDILFRLTDHHDREFALGPTHEEVFVEVFKRNARSYRDLPVLLYQIAPKFRDEPRPRGGLIRLRQFIMKDLYSFDADLDGLEASYRKMYDAYQRIFGRCGVPTVPVLADSGAMGGRDTHEFIYLTEYGEDSCLICPGCGYAANAEVAAFVKEPAHAGEEPAAMQEIDTPGLYTIQALAEHLGVPASRTCKAVFYSAVYRDRQEPVFVAIRGDMEVNEAKLRGALGALELRYMSDQEAEKAGFVAGSASAVGLRAGALSHEESEAGVLSHKTTSGPGGAPAPGNVRIVADDLVPLERNLVAGANKPDKHLLNVNYERDWRADVVADIAHAREGYLCAQCRSPMDLQRGVEMGQVFKLGTKYAEDFGALFLDAEGKQRPAVMGSYGIGVERLLAGVIEANHDESGIIWPRALAPYDVHIVALQPERPEIREAAEGLYGELLADGLAVLYDDREESPGVKFNDADLLGMPLRVTVSPRNLEKGSLELRLRTAGESELVPAEGAAAAIRQRLG
ncbi:MAG: proline--tRNA ligase [Dehalococcoidia bacterium]|nr:proline--tRNA ligase [Dehalococcoidia bacterium]